MKRSEDSFERELERIGQTYDRMWRRDPDAIWRQINASRRRSRREAPQGGWWVAASALVLLLACGGGVLHWSARIPAGVKLTFIPPKARTAVVYKVTSQYRDVIGRSKSGIPGKTETGSSQQQMQVVIVPTAGGGYKLTMRDEPVLAIVDGKSLASGYPPGRSFYQPTTMTWLVGATGKLLSVRVTPASAHGSLYAGDTMRDPLLPPAPDKVVTPGATWLVDAAAAAGTLPGLPGRYTYEGVVGGYLKVHFSATWTDTTTPWGEFVGQPSRYVSIGDIYLAPVTHLPERFTERTTGTGTKTVTDNGTMAPSSAPDHSEFQWTWQRTR
jgi:hypothetical protein